MKGGKIKGKKIVLQFSLGVLHGDLFFFCVFTQYDLSISETFHLTGSSNH